MPILSCNVPLTEMASAFQNCDCRSCSGSGKALCSDGTCLDRSRVCDGITDCSDGVDEEDCPGSCILDETVKVSDRGSHPAFHLSFAAQVQRCLPFSLVLLQNLY